MDPFRPTCKVQGERSFVGGNNAAAGGGLIPAWGFAPPAFPQHLSQRGTRRLQPFTKSPRRMPIGARVTFSKLLLKILYQFWCSLE